MAARSAGGALHVALEHLAIGGAAAVGALLVWRLAPALAQPGVWPGLLLAAGLGLVVADLASGLVHWSADRLLPDDAPYLGPNFVRPFHEHHENPQGIARHGFVEINGNTCIVALPLLAAHCLWVDPSRGEAMPLLADVFALSLGFWSCLTNQVHQWAHVPEPPGLVRRLQRARLILDRRHHGVHHRAPYDTRFCITTGWWNPVLDRSGLLPALERGLGGALRARAGGL